MKSPMPSTPSRSWTPPDGLERCRPRQVRLTHAGKALLAGACTLWATAVGCGVALQVAGVREREELRQLREEGANTEAEITRLWHARGDSRQPRMAYRFSVQGRPYGREVRTGLRGWRNLRVGATLPVRYLPRNPALNYPLGTEPEAMPLLVPFLVAILLATGGAGALFVIVRERRLVAEGRAARAVVTGHRRPRKGGTTYVYEFAVLSGAIVRGKSGPSKKPPAIGTLVCVVYDSDNPRRSAPYPSALVASAGGSLR